MPNNNILSIHTADELIDLNDLRVFAYVASLASFSLAADALKIHKSSVSRSIARLESMLETPLIQRTTRKVELTGRGAALRERCLEFVSHVNETIKFVATTKKESSRDRKDSRTAASSSMEPAAT
ncbi:LysR family transcriptional regulator [Variovorax sp. YR216]|uniref:LysR family transcriptional regulator n=1 Tax=Variovorax sp. YR216 TaxID=1882828 RepID=UPI000895BB76|nr:LysR family transcriptional regulator [Variovorax sp. YR216]SEA01429.1 regulatory helix-turn-helix protein, lysR family [Variovorax sp. YR216]